MSRAPDPYPFRPCRCDRPGCFACRLVPAYPDPAAPGCPPILRRWAGWTHEQAVSGHAPPPPPPAYVPCRHELPVVSWAECNCEGKHVRGCEVFDLCTRVWVRGGGHHVCTAGRFTDRCEYYSAAGVSEREIIG